MTRPDGCATYSNLPYIDSVVLSRYFTRPVLYPVGEGNEGLLILHLMEQTRPGKQLPSVAEAQGAPASNEPRMPASAPLPRLGSRHPRRSVFEGCGCTRRRTRKAAAEAFMVFETGKRMQLESFWFGCNRSRSHRALDCAKSGLHRQSSAVSNDTDSGPTPWAPYRINDFKGAISSPRRQNLLHRIGVLP